MKITRATAVLFVAAIEPSLAFWRDAVGFTVSVSVPEGDALGFAALERDGTEVMLQTYASLAHDMPHAAKAARDGSSFLFIEVDDLADIERRLAAYEPAMPRRQTFYGSEETGYREPGGHFVTFAQFAR
jgi:catechol 2,3-dioxygenase-like lactoylglutathione lyase family enzyme